MPLDYKNVTVARNNASITGGGLFVNAVDELDLFFIEGETSTADGTKRNEGTTHVYLKNNRILVSRHVKTF